MKKSFLLVIVVLIFMLVLTGCHSGKQQSEDVTQSEKEVTQSKTDTGITGDDLTVSDQERKKGDKKEKSFISPFTGKYISKNMLNRALMVSIENSAAARPQSGLAEADIVYEFLVEGGITRFLALYWHEIPGKIGPVRSLRPYLIKTALEYNPLLLHAGASPAGFNMLSEVDIKNLDQIYRGKYFWRDGSRNKPHNLYTGFFKIDSYIKEITGQDYRQRFSFQQIRLMSDRDITAKNININYWGTYNVLYKYVAEKNIYNRFLYDFSQPHLTETGEQITAKNVIVKYVKTDVKDDIGRLTMELTGKGKALLFRDGTVIEGYWQKEKTTKYYNLEDKELMLNPGTTWIQVVPEYTSVNYGSGDFIEKSTGR